MTDDPPALPDAIHAVAALDDTLRRGMYDHIRKARAPVSRDQAAAAVGISRKLAAFHLDRLVDAGLLEVSFAPPAGAEPRIGRAPKRYRASNVDDPDRLARLVNLVAALGAELGPVRFPVHPRRM